MKRGVRCVGISDVRDESDREGMRVVVEVKRGSSPEVTRDTCADPQCVSASHGSTLLSLFPLMGCPCNRHRIMHCVCPVGCRSTDSVGRALLS